ncbi:DUF1824 family protein [Synechococcus sp. GFB01]|uniref:DUF1824 family protein n=1 Tax=Synechococcus sp. GFB01 TaxID=1662190 RepID=UPI00064F9E75|nr:DUF1824 family protein [Synechococcus sp. GFB01]KMM16981.1 hypothetical protein SYNGFB01_07195 [Synechococcus sp. GFB01]
MSLIALRGLRTAPVLTEAERLALRAELLPRLEACDWFTVGVMAPSAQLAVECLRQLEAALGWDPLELDPAGEALAAIEGPVFLKANQTSRRFLVRREAGLGEGLLITGHSPADPEAEDTWGPLPLDFFGP